MTATEEATPQGLEGAAAAPPSAAEVAALRARLREVEALLGLPLRPGRAAPADLPALRQRVAALERRLGIVPGLDPLPGCDGAATPARATAVTSEPAGRQGWRERGRAALALAALVAGLAWLLHPLPGGPGVFRAAAPAVRPAAATLATVPASAYRVSPPSEADSTSPDTAHPAAPAATRGDDATARDDLLRQCRFGDVLCLPDGDATADVPPCPGDEVIIAGQCVIP
ncbi:MAG TPA: hypothetical protein VFL91_21420 [Thermomicrobiales bacterium]|nr:hypothetical protein [Thermomicrobiales bacterium]